MWKSREFSRDCGNNLKRFYAELTFMIKTLLPASYYPRSLPRTGAWTMSDEDFLPPLEIPWKLASTTQPLTNGEPAETTISFFTFQPDDDALNNKFKDHRLIFLKVTVSISPATFPPGTAPAAASVLGEGIPCFHVLLDLRVRKSSGDLGTIHPYFHTAAPMRRQMIQTGVIGVESFEGESENQLVGKSGSQMYETGSSHSTTSSVSGSMNFGIAGSSVRRSTTDVESSRNVTQVSDVTNRAAAQERRELVSHTTRVENILSLLSAKYIGTPYLSFSLSPPPLQQLSVDASDPSLWYGQLLHRRSSGIEGVQEFTTVIVVPKDEDFCVNARLRRVCLLDDPPGLPDFNEPWEINKVAKVARLLRHLETTYPKGTPLDELDLDLTPSLNDPNQDKFPFPFVEAWAFGGNCTFADVVSMGRLQSQINRAELNYKPHIALWLDTLRAEYERELARSPLERGVLVGENRHLDQCFAFDGGNLKFMGFSTTVSPLTPIDLRDGTFDPGNAGATTEVARTSPKARALATVTRWNALESHMTTLLNNLRKFPDRPNRLNDGRIVDVLVNRWAKLSRNDPRNLDFSKAMKSLKLTEKQQATLKAAGVTDLKSLADALNAAPIVELYNRDLASRPAEAAPADAAVAPAVTPIEFPLSEADAQQIRKRIGDNLLANTP
jgi:hypothetical protein